MRLGEARLTTLHQLFPKCSGLDWTQPKDEKLPPDTPIIVALHGLTGGSYEPYVRSVLAIACRSKSEGGLGYRAVVMNFRGCGSETPRVAALAF
jgi:predicted alpha/beta-fold hydrolase